MTKTEDKELLGKKGKDKLTGFKGTIVGIADYVWGCRYIAVVGEKLDKDGKPMDIIWFDHDRIEAIVKKAKPTKRKPKKEPWAYTGSGGPGDTPSRPSMPRVASPGNETYK